jgi:hypothetical protein
LTPEECRALVKMLSFEIFGVQESDGKFDNPVEQRAFDEVKIIFQKIIDGADR